MDTAPKIVLQNPYRILGVYANATKKDIVANKGKATAFLKVNKPVEYPLDLKGILPPLTRTLDMMNGAEAHLAIAKEQINYAQFWFLQKMSPLDDIAFNHLLAGNMAGAIEIWTKQESLSSLQNRLVCYLIEGKHELAVKVAERLYEKFGNDYISKVDANCTLQMTATDLLHQFVDSLGEEIGMQTMLDFTLGDDTKAYISSQTIGPLINKISSEVDKTKKVDHKDPKARIEAARKLVANTKEALSQLKSILPATDSQYQMIADKLGLEILQCGIDYFNNSEDDDAPHTAIKMQKYAQSVVVGNLAKQRCAENVKILQTIIDELPPKEVMAEDKAIKAELSKFVRLPDKIYYAISLLNNTKPFLQAIKQKLGVTNAYYLKLSTRIVSNALHNIVEEVNAAQKGDTFEIGGTEIEIPADLLTPAQRLEKINKIKTAVREAWKATILMDDFDLESDFRPHYNENKNTLKSMCNQMGISTYVSRPTSTYNQKTGRASMSSNTSSASTNKPKEHQIISKSNYKWIWALFIHALITIIAYCIYYFNPETIEWYEKWTYIGWGFGIGSVSWIITPLISNQKTNHKGWIIFSLIGLIVLISVGLIWGLSGYSTFLRILGVIGVITAIGGIGSKEEGGCLVGFIAGIIAGLCFLGANGLENLSNNYKMREEKRKTELIEQKKEANDYANLIASPSIDKCWNFLQNHPNSIHSNEVYEIYNYTLGNDDLNRLNDLAGKYSDTEWGNLAKKRVNEISDSLYQVACKTNTIDGWNMYQKAVPREYYADSNDKIEQIKNEAWSTDNKAWKQATKENTLNAYKKYLNMYPRGTHKNAADKKIIDLEVQSVINSGDYGYLPPSQKISYGTSQTSAVHIKNSSSSTITILYSGTKSLRIVLSPSQSQTIYLPSSSYKVVATAPGVRSFYGTENLTGGDYESEYYITTTRY